MQPDEIFREMIRRRGLSNREASKATGRSIGYFSRMISKGVSPGTGVLADLGNALDFDLILRDRKDGTEIRIDPPEE